MRESAAELEALQALLDWSHAGATGHLRAIITPDRGLAASEIAGLLSGMRVLSLATVTARAEPRISAVDGHFLHGRWVFTTDGSAAKARHLRERPVVSAAYIEGEEWAVFAHGRVDFLDDGHPDRQEVLEHLIAHYGSNPMDWGDAIVLCRVDASWMVGYAGQRDELLRSRGVAPAPR